MERQTVLKSELDHLLQQETVELVQLKRYFDIKLSGNQMQAILLKVFDVEDKDLAKKYTESLFHEKALIRSLSHLRRASKDDLKECGLAIAHVNQIIDKLKESASSSEYHKMGDRIDIKITWYQPGKEQPTKLLTVLATATVGTSHSAICKAFKLNPEVYTTYMHIKKRVDGEEEERIVVQPDDIPLVADMTYFVQFELKNQNQAALLSTLAVPKVNAIKAAEMAKHSRSSMAERSEGLPSNFHCKRPELLKFLVEQAVAKRRVLVNAPPQSGKTSTCGLLFHYAHEITDCQVVFLSFAGFTRTSPIEDFVTRKLDGNDFFKLLSDPSVIMVIDEAQNAYHEQAWWSHFKGEGNRLKCAILVFAAYGSNRQGPAHSAMKFEVYLSFRHLAFLRNEFEECIAFYRSNGYAQILTDQVTDQIRFRVKHVLGCNEEKFHPGLTIACIELVVEKCTSEESAMTFIDQCGISQNLDSRCLVRFKDLLNGIQSENEKQQMKNDSLLLDQDKLTKILRDCIRKLVVKGLIEIRDAQDGYYSYFFDMLVKYGYCYENQQDKYYAATCPLVRAHLVTFMTKLHNTEINYEFGTKKDALRLFVVQAFKLVNRDNLNRSYSRKEEGGQLHEVAYLCEFYSAAKSIYTGTISCDVGSFFRNRGKLDLYINNRVNNGIEFLVNGRRLEEHVESFNTGHYSKMGQMKDFLVVDIYQEKLIDRIEQIPDTFHDKYLAVLFKNNFTAIEFYVIVDNSLSLYQ